MRAVLASLVAFSVLSACGAETSEPDPPAASGEWTQQRIAASPGADAPTGFVADGDEVLVTALSDEGVLTSHLSVDGGEFRAGEPVVLGGLGYPGFADPVRLDGVWWLVGSGGMTGEGRDEEIAFEPQVLRSEDGLTWERVEVTGIPAPVDLNEVVAVDGALVVGGDKRNGVDSAEGASFEAAVWRSEDGSDWTEVALPDVVPLPDYRDESVVTGVVRTGDRLLAVGGLGRDTALWVSDDAGKSWTRSSALGELGQVSGLASDGSVVLVNGGGRLLRSDDGGDTFRKAADQPTAGGEEGWARLWAGTGHFFTFTEPSYDTFSDPEVCYADFAQCGLEGSLDGAGYIHASDGGDEWTVVDTADLGLGDEFVGAVETADGRVSFAHAVEGGLLVTRWPDGSDLPEGARVGEPVRIELVQVPEGAEPEPGVRYHAPLYIHCGMEWLYLGDTPWQRTDGGPEVETGAGDDPSADWPMAGETIYGYATLGGDGVVQYSIGGEGDEVIATYEQTGAKPPGCD